MRRVVVSQTGTGSTAPVPCDQYLSPVNITLFTEVTGTATYNIEATGDDVYAADFDPTTATWYAHTVLSNVSVSAQSNYAFPISALRLNVTSGTGTVKLTVLEAGVQ